VALWHVPHPGTALRGPSGRRGGSIKITAQPLQNTERGPQMGILSFHPPRSRLSPSESASRSRLSPRGESTRSRLSPRGGFKAAKRPPNLQRAGGFTRARVRLSEKVGYARSRFSPRGEPPRTPFPFVPAFRRNECPGPAVRIHLAPRGERGEFRPFSRRVGRASPDGRDRESADSLSSPVGSIGGFPSWGRPAIPRFRVFSGTRVPVSFLPFISKEFVR